jgi:hypothetical protein
LLVSGAVPPVSQVGVFIWQLFDYVVLLFGVVETLLCLPFVARRSLVLRALTKALTAAWSYMVMVQVLFVLSCGMIRWVIVFRVLVRGCCVGFWLVAMCSVFVTACSQVGGIRFCLLCKPLVCAGGRRTTAIAVFSCRPCPSLSQAFAVGKPDHGGGCGTRSSPSKVSVDSVDT